MENFDFLGKMGTEEQRKFKEEVSNIMDLL